MADHLDNSSLDFRQTINRIVELKPVRFLIEVGRIKGIVATDSSYRERRIVFPL